MLTIRQLEEDDAEDWTRLYDGFRQFHRLERDARVNQQAWEWLIDAHHACVGLVAELDDRLVGFAHFRLTPRTILGDELMLLDDLYTSPSARGQGVASALIAKLEAIAETHGVCEMQWTTNPWNETARAYYRRISEVTDWVIYRKLLSLTETSTPGEG